MPNIEKLRAWVEALESGNYEQGRKALKNIWSEDGKRKVGLCCLGVACEVALGDEDFLNLCPSAGWDAGSFVWQDEDDGMGVLEEDGELPLPVRDWLGIPGDPLLVGHSAAERNDTLEQDFAEIAAAVREQYSLGPKVPA